MITSKKTRIGILDFSTLNTRPSFMKSDGPKAVKALARAIREEGHIPVLYKAEKCQMYFHGKRSEILYNNKKIKGCDVLIPKFILSRGVDVAVTLISQFENMGIPVINGSLPIKRAKNKLRTLQILTQHSIAVPKTFIVRKLEFIHDAVKSIGGYPVVLKIPFGAAGSGVVLAESQRALFSALDVIWMRNDPNIILVQEYIREAKGEDYRAFVIDQKVVASMKRTARSEDFRSNLHRGGGGTKTSLTPQEKKIALKATRILGLKVAGVDILRSKKGPLIMEVNANPGFLGISHITGVKVAKNLVQYAVRLAKKHKNV